MTRPHTNRPAPAAPDPDLASQLRLAFTAADSESAWYFDRVALRVVRVTHGATNIPDLPAADVEDDEDRYAEIPAILESDVHGWMEEFVEDFGGDAVASLLDERHGANARFETKLAAANPEAFAAWKRWESARIDAVIADWRAALPPA